MLFSSESKRQYIILAGLLAGDSVHTSANIMTTDSTRLAAATSSLVTTSPPVPTASFVAVVPSSTNVITSIVSASSTPPSTQLFTSIVTASGDPDDSLAPVTVVVTSVYQPSTGTAAASSKIIKTLSGLPLTTIFTPPAYCSSQPFTLRASSNTSIGVWRFQDNSSDPCYPPLWATAKTNHYIPGACPAGYTYARVARGISSSSSFTSVNCCPM